MRKILFVLWVLCVAPTLVAQEVLLKGKVLSENGPAAGVQVMNLVNEKTAISDSMGEFFILAKEEDLIVFPTSNYEYKRRLIDSEDIKNRSFTVKLVAKPIQLEEVVVLKDINPEDLGLVPKGQKKLTVAERRLFAAETGPVDIVVNALTGRTKMLKKVVQAEKKQRYLEKLHRLFPERYFTEKLKIPQDYVNGFLYYAVEFDDIQQPLKNNQVVQADLKLTLLAQEYLKLLYEGIEYPEEK